VSGCGESPPQLPVTRQALHPHAIPAVIASPPPLEMAAAAAAPGALPPLLGGSLPPLPEDDNRRRTATVAFDEDDGANKRAVSEIVRSPEQLKALARYTRLNKWTGSDIMGGVRCMASEIRYRDFSNVSKMLLA
jgi:hypothetical protein